MVFCLGLSEFAFFVAGVVVGAVGALGVASGFLWTQERRLKEKDSGQLEVHDSVRAQNVKEQAVVIRNKEQMEGRKEPIADHKPAAAQQVSGVHLKPQPRSKRSSSRRSERRRSRSLKGDRERSLKEKDAEHREVHDSVRAQNVKEQAVDFKNKEEMEGKKEPIADQQSEGVSGVHRKRRSRSKRSSSRRNERRRSRSLKGDRERSFKAEDAKYLKVNHSVKSQNEVERAVAIADKEEPGNQKEPVAQQQPEQEAASGVHVKRRHMSKRSSQRSNERRRSRSRGQSASQKGTKEPHSGSEQSDSAYYPTSPIEHRLSKLIPERKDARKEIASVACPVSLKPQEPQKIQ